MDETVDVAIVGAGLAGTSLAIGLARAGVTVALIDTHAVFPAEFRAEKLGGVHMELFDALGLGAEVRAAITPMDERQIYRFGRRVAHDGGREYGFAYATLVNGLRGALPPGLRIRTARIAEVSAGPDRQRLVFNDASALEARLLVIATGLGDVVRRQVGIKRVVEVKGHSLSLGFTLERPASTYGFENLTCYPRDRSERASYITLFKIGDTIRANFFVYREAGEDWTKAFVKAPDAALCRLMPEIAELCGGFRVAGGIKVRPIDLIATEGHRRDGVVLVGDAFRTTCPVPGVGVRRAMTDVSRLCVERVPRWLATPGMGVDKIGDFYDDPVKQAMDADAVRASLYARRIVVDDGPVWAARRLRNGAARRCLYPLAALRRRIVPDEPRFHM